MKSVKACPTFTFPATIIVAIAFKPIAFTIATALPTSFIQNLSIPVFVFSPSFSHNMEILFRTIWTHSRRNPHSLSHLHTSPFSFSITSTGRRNVTSSQFPPAQHSSSTLRSSRISPSTSLPRSFPPLHVYTEASMLSFPPIDRDAVPINCDAQA